MAKVTPFGDVKYDIKLQTKMTVRPHTLEGENKDDTWSDALHTYVKNHKTAPIFKNLFKETSY